MISAPHGEVGDVPVVASPDHEQAVGVLLDLMDV
jgi:hypothetical protein